jgi:hypothetical protein
MRVPYRPATAPGSNKCGAISCARPGHHEDIERPQERSDLGKPGEEAGVAG